MKIVFSVCILEKSVFEKSIIKIAEFHKTSAFRAPSGSVPCGGAEEEGARRASSDRTEERRRIRVRRKGAKGNFRAIYEN